MSHYANAHYEKGSEKRLSVSSVLTGPTSIFPPIRSAAVSMPVTNVGGNPPDELLSLKSLLRSQQDRLNKNSDHAWAGNDAGEDADDGPSAGGNVEERAARCLLPTRPQPVASGARYNLRTLSPGASQRETSGDTPSARSGAAGSDDGDSEVRRLEEDLKRRHSRIDRLRRDMMRTWKESGTQKEASISPPEPQVFNAKSDREVIELATLVYNFSDHNKRNRFNSVAGGCFTQTMTERGTAADIIGESSFSSPDFCDGTEGLFQSATITGGVSGRSCSLLYATDSAVILMEALSISRDVGLNSFLNLGFARNGDVLSENHILIVDHWDTLRARNGSTGFIAGAPYFRMLPRLNVAGVAQPTISGVRTIVNQLRRIFDGPIVWINLREEPLIYINNEAHIVRERKEPFNPMIIPNVTGRSIAQIENKLKQEVLQEARDNGGNISLYVEGSNGLMGDQWESADAEHVSTLDEVFNTLRSSVTYHRRPITRLLGPQPQDFDFVFSTCVDDTQSVLVFNCQTGRGKTGAMMFIATIVRFYQLCPQDASLDVRLLRIEGRSFNFRTIKKIVSLIPDGKLHERRVMALLDISENMYSIADHISAAFTAASTSTEEDIMHLRQYAYFLVFSYYCEQRLWNFKINIPFSTWLSENNELKLLISCIKSMEEEFKEERIAAPLDVGDEARAASIVHRRRGNVLSAGRILCRVEAISTKQAKINAFWQLAPDVPIFACGRLTEAERFYLMDEVREHFPNSTSVNWLSLRAEPMVFINDLAFTLSDYDNISDNPTELASTMHVSLKAIQQIEERLRRDVILEAQENKGFILLHYVDHSGKRSTMRVKINSVRTPTSIMMEFSNASGISYYRVPIPFGGHILPSDVDPLLEYISRFKGENDIFFVSDTEGQARTSVALNIIILYRTAKARNLRLIKNADDITEVLRVGHNGVVLPSAQLLSSIPVNSDEVPKGPVELRVAFTICQMLTAGSLLRVVKAAISLCGSGKRWNILHLLNFVKEEMIAVPNKAKLMRYASRIVRTYLLILLSAIYIDSMGDYSQDVPFSDWVEERVEVANIIANIDQRTAEVLKYMDFSNLKKGEMTHRNGDVLTANYALKADHFPGCQKKGLRPRLCGAPNFRKVDSVNVYGVAIPTLLGIRNILSLLGASQESLATYPGEQNDKDIYIGFAAPRLFDPLFRPEELPKPLRGHVVWVNLRGEPILYVGDRPFVLRNLDTPYVNVDLSGIPAHKVEEVEMQLMADVLKEAEQHGGMILVNDEGEPGELVSIWESATRETVKTLREVYNELAGHGFRVTLLRLPVTDEQSPSTKDFDALVEVLLPRVAMHMDRRETLSFVFNCQLGRGRTTTGMVICCLLIGVVMPEYYDGLNKMYNPLYKEEDSLFSRGEYSCIVQLKRLLTGGRTAKHHVDLVIEACSMMQNLRTAIEDFALQAKSPDVTESQRGRAHYHGVHYLRRYFNLITFAAYLDEEYISMKKQMQCTYASWLAQRPELVTLCDSAALR